MQDQPVGPMTADNVEDFDVRIFDSCDLFVSVIPLQAPWAATDETYQLNQSA